jgi:hypothetical protein
MSLKSSKCLSLLAVAGKVKFVGEEKHLSSASYVHVNLCWLLTDAV